MASMGLGSYLSRFVGERLLETFIAVQLFIAIVGGTSALVLFNAFSVVDNYTAFLLFELVAIGSAVGLEIPLVIRILDTYRILKLNISNVLSLDYVGALFASLLFPLVLVPQLGLIRTSALFGLLNALVAAMGLWIFNSEIRRRRSLYFATGVCGVILTLIFVRADAALGFFESRLYAGDVIHAQTTPYQRIVVSKSNQSVNLFINGALQFSSIDEYRYHEALVHPVMSLARRHNNILVLGGGDGLALREVLKYEDVGKVVLVDLDPEMTQLFSRNPLLAQLNGAALSDPRVTIYNEDAWEFVVQAEQSFDVVIVDLPDPHNLSLSKLYSKTFYAHLARIINGDALIVTQATSPMFARRAFWSIAQTLSEVGSPLNRDEQLQIQPYHAYVPSFGEWGFILAAPRLPPWERIELSVRTRFLDAAVLSGMTTFPTDMARLEVEANTIHDHVLPKYYEADWSQWYE